MLGTSLIFWYFRMLHTWKRLNIKAKTLNVQQSRICWKRSKEIYLLLPVYALSLQIKKYNTVLTNSGFLQNDAQNLICVLRSYLLSGHQNAVSTIWLGLMPSTAGLRMTFSSILEIWSFWTGVETWPLRFEPFGGWPFRSETWLCRIGGYWVNGKVCLFADGDSFQPSP